MARLVARWERSGLTQAAFARQCGMSVHTLTWWRWRLRTGAASAPPAVRAPAVAFTEVVLTPPAASAVAEVVLRNGWVVRVPLTGVDAPGVRTLVAALDAPC
jgi:transposase-like protein